ncbi:MAG: nucleotidyl transferase AbiEii/AbiGii toxin family protein [bacterium]
MIKQEQFELEVLDRLNSKRFLNNLIFGGGTMLRLCFGLNRFSVELDLWATQKCNTDKLYQDIKTYLAQYYSIKDATQKFYTLLFEIRSADYPRSLKIEIRKQQKKVRTDQAIAYSKYSTIQVFMKVISLKDMMDAIIEAFLARKEIRDIFDIEFLFKKGIAMDVSPEILTRILKGIDSFKKQDYTVKLGSLLEKDQRKYYTAENFKILKMNLMGDPQIPK